MQDTACIILARGGSKGVLHKNLRQVQGVSLIGRAVRAARASASVDATYVSTDDAAIAQEARKHGAIVIERPADLSGSAASSESGWLHALRTIKTDRPDLKHLVMLQCTSPFITGADIDGCLAAMIRQKAVCALSVIEDHSFLWTVDAQGVGIGMNHDHTAQRKRRQDLPPQYRESGAIYCVQVSAFETAGVRFCGPAALYPVGHPPMEIDTEADLALCQRIAADPSLGPLDINSLQRVRAVVMDFDGVHTDNLVQVHQDGTETVRTSRGDGMGLQMLRDLGDIDLMILSKERNPVVLARAQKLKIEVHHAVDDKVATLEKWLGSKGLTWGDLLYVGNDVNDAAAMQASGLSACPCDAHPDILSMADWILPAPGGKGALRAMCDAMLGARAQHSSKRS